MGNAISYLGGSYFGICFSLISYSFRPSFPFLHLLPSALHHTQFFILHSPCWLFFVLFCLYCASSLCCFTITPPQIFVIVLVLFLFYAFSFYISFLFSFLLWLPFPSSFFLFSLSIFYLSFCCLSCISQRL